MMCKFQCSNTVSFPMLVTIYGKRHSFRRGTRFLFVHIRKFVGSIRKRIKGNNAISLKPVKRLLVFLHSISSRREFSELLECKLLEESMGRVWSMRIRLAFLSMPFFRHRVVNWRVRFYTDRMVKTGLCRCSLIFPKSIFFKTKHF